MLYVLIAFILPGGTKESVSSSFVHGKSKRPEDQLTKSHRMNDSADFIHNFFILYNI